MHIVCPGCGAINRVPPERAQDNPQCGQCGTPVLPNKPVALSDAALAKYIAKTEAPVLVDFWAEWCGPCRSFAPQFAQAAEQRPDIRFVKVDSDQAPQASARFGIRSIPTLLLLLGGHEVNRMSGAMSAGQLLNWLDGALKTTRSRA